VVAGAVVAGAVVAGAVVAGAVVAGAAVVVVEATDEISDRSPEVTKTATSTAMTAIASVANPSLIQRRPPGEEPPPEGAPAACAAAADTMPSRTSAVGEAPMASSNISWMADSTASGSMFGNG
jgi:hypothetical protein